MAYNYQIPNYCPMCSSCLSSSHNNTTPCYSQYNCDQYLPYHYYNFPSNLPEQTKPSTDKRKKLTRSQSSCCISREACRVSERPCITVRKNVVVVNRNRATSQHRVAILIDWWKWCVIRNTTAAARAILHLYLHWEIQLLLHFYNLNLLVNYY